MGVWNLKAVYDGRNSPMVTQGLVLYLDAGNFASYPGTGTTWTDLSGTNNSGTLNNGPTYTNTDGGYITLDGINDTISITDNATLDITSAITIDAWVYATKSTASTQNILSKSSSTENNGYIFPRTEDTWSNVRFYLNIGGWKILTATWPGRDRWVHTAATYDGATMIIYVNGISSASLAQSGAISTNGNNLILGDQPAYNEFYGGRISNIKMYNRALSAAEIAQNFYAFKERFGM